MQLLSVILLIGIAALFVLGYQIYRKLNVEKKEDQSMVMLQKQLFEIEKSLKAQDKTMGDSLKQQFAVSSKIIKDVMESVQGVTEKLTKLDATNKQIVGFAEQMKSLENILKNPKQRGVLGEFFLENLLSQQLPPTHFEMQYRFKSGEAVDAVIRVRDYVIPVDAKFSLENYNRLMEEKNEAERERLEKEFKMDLKKRIDETSKYVRPKEGTTDFAFMFIPADGVFYNLLSYKIGGIDVNTKDLIEYAFEKRVILVSPMTFYAYLQTVMQGLKALVIEKQAVEIQKRVADLGRHLNAYQDFMVKVGGHLGTTVNAYNNAGHEFGKIDKDVLKITGAEEGMAEVPAIERPAEFDRKIKVQIKAPARGNAEVEA
ncbi:DNA recombination protein RmuC [Candidatus Peregrinibacteria bacterium]|nr:DNA recombination protein RmuC [Candidatus Peregrinibacteria bacterium]